MEQVSYYDCRLGTWLRYLEAKENSAQHTCHLSNAHAWNHSPSWQLTLPMMVSLLPRTTVSLSLTFMTGLVVDLFCVCRFVNWDRKKICYVVMMGELTVMWDLDSWEKSGDTNTGSLAVRGLLNTFTRDTHTILFQMLGNVKSTFYL